jgi:hypothetical protein
MAFYIFQKNSDNIEGAIIKVAENEYYLNLLNIIKSDYKIIEDNQTDFNLIKLNNIFPKKYDQNLITFEDLTHSFNNKNNLKSHIENISIILKYYLNNNENHELFNLWNDYYNQLNSLKLDNITYPLNKSLEQYLNDLGQPSYNILQLP